MKKDKGIFKNLVSFVPVFLITLFTLILLQLQIHQASSVFIEDALAASNLASAVIDVEEYGISHQLLINDPREACGIFKRALQANLALNDKWESQNSSMIAGLVKLDEYAVYEVRGNDIVCYAFPGGSQENMHVTEYKDGAGNLEAPDGTKIESTSIYSRISFQVRFFHQIIDVYKQKCVDVVEN